FPNTTFSQNNGVIQLTGVASRHVGYFIALFLAMFNIYGGEGAVGNRLFLPVYGALWTLIAVADRRAILASAASLVLAAPFMMQLWLSPWRYPISGDQGYLHVTRVAQRLLPYEASQRWMPAGDMADHNGLRVKFLNPRGWAETQRGRLMFDNTGSLDLLIGSMQPLDRIRLDFGRDAPSEISVSGGELEERLLQPSGEISFRIEPHNWWRRHPMWWTPKPQWLYRLTLDIDASELEQLDAKPGRRPLGFQLFGEQFEP
ncbi:MAG: solute carrier family 23 protein, partial [Acidobacteriota bacterium]